MTLAKRGFKINILLISSGKHMPSSGVSNGYTRVFVMKSKYTNAIAFVVLRLFEEKRGNKEFGFP